MNNWIAAVVNVFNRVIPSEAGITAGSPYDFMHRADEHIHSAAKVYPTLANGVLVESDGAGWTLGAFVEIVPATTIGDEFDIHHIHVEAVSANDTLELVIYAGAGDVEVGRIRLTKNAVQDSIVNMPFQTPIIAADSRIRAKVASASGGTDVTISIKYHTY